MPDQLLGPDASSRLSQPVASPAGPKEDPPPLPVSPTGTPVIPPAWVPWLTVLGVVAAVVAALPTMGVTLPAIVPAIATAVVGVLAALGVASPGLRKQ